VAQVDLRARSGLEQTMMQTPETTKASNRRNERRPLFLCPITRRPCEGDLSYLCEDYGCARKGGLSLRSEENL
jgi:hypothetical protein